IGLGVVSSLATVVVLIGWLRFAGVAGTFQPTDGGMLVTMQWWLVFWLALSAGLLLSLWLGYRGWRVFYSAHAGAPASRDRTLEERETREAIAAAEAIVQAARRNPPER